MCLSVSSVYLVRKLGIITGVKEADHRSRLTTSRRAELLHSLSSPQKAAEEKASYATPTLGTRPTFQPQLLSASLRVWGRLLVFCHLMWLFEGAVQPARGGCACCSPLAPLFFPFFFFFFAPLPRGRGRSFKAWQSWTFPGLLHLTLPQIAVPRCLDGFCSAILFHRPFERAGFH